MRTAWIRWLLAPALLAGLSSAIWAVAAHAQTEARIGFVNSERLFTEYDAFRDAERAYQNELDGWLEEARKREQDLVELDSQYRAQEPMLSEERRRTRQQELQVATQEFEAFRQSVFAQGGKAQRRNQELLEPVLAQVQVAVEKVAEENDFDLIFDAVDGNIIYGVPRYDITEQVLDELRAAAGDETVPATDGAPDGTQETASDPDE